MEHFIKYILAARHFRPLRDEHGAVHIFIMHDGEKDLGISVHVVDIPHIEGIGKIDDAGIG